MPTCFPAGGSIRWTLRVLLSFMIFSSVGLCRAQQVCVRPIHPAVSQAHVQVVIDAFRKKHVTATACGKEFQPVEVWIYPLSFSFSGDTQYWVTANPMQGGGVVGTVQTDTPTYTGSAWVMSLHPNGKVWSTRRYQGTSLKSEGGRMAKWIRKHYLRETKSK